MATRKTETEEVEPEGTDDELLAIDPALAKEALALPDDVVVPLRVNLTQARANVLLAAAAVLGQRLVIEAKLKKAHFRAAQRIEALVNATEAASRAAARLEKSANAHEADLARLWPLRALLLSMAEVLAGAGYLPMTVVDAIRAGTGNLDAAKDLIDLADLFTKNARKLVGKMGPITKDDLIEAKQLGTRLVSTVKPTGTRAPKPIDLQRKEALNLRDRLNTLLVIDYETTWFLGAAAFGSKVSNFVPPLGSGGTRPPAAEKAEAKPKKPKKGADPEPEAEDTGE